MRSPAPARSRIAWSGASVIAAETLLAMAKKGITWTVDDVITDADRCAAAVSWTRHEAGAGEHRGHDLQAIGVDWCVFDPETTRIWEIRTYSTRPIVD